MIVLRQRDARPRVAAPMAKERLAGRDQCSDLAVAVASKVLGIVEETRASQLGALVTAYNPFEQLPQLRRWKHRVQAISVSSTRNELAQHPSLERLQQRPIVRRAIDRLRADPELERIFQSGRPLDRQAAAWLPFRTWIAVYVSDQPLGASPRFCLAEPDAGAPRPNLLT